MNPIVASMPAKAWLALLLACAVVVGVGLAVLRVLQQRHHEHSGRQFPLCGVSFVTGPLVGLLLFAIAFMTAPDDWESIDLRNLFNAIMIFSTDAGSLVAVVVLLVVDLPRYRRFDPAVDCKIRNDDAHDGPMTTQAR